jgi:surface antigen
MQILLTPIAVALLALFPAPTVHYEPHAVISTIKPIKALIAPSLPTYEALTYQPFPYSPVGTYANPYPVGQCTHLVASMKGNIPVWGDANQWPAHARAVGITVSDTPMVGSVGVERLGNHVVLVTSVNDGTITVEEGNYDYHGSIRSYIYPTSKFNYLYL